MQSQTQYTHTHTYSFQSYLFIKTASREEGRANNNNNNKNLLEIIKIVCPCTIMVATAIEKIFEIQQRQPVTMEQHRRRKEKKKSLISWLECVLMFVYRWEWTMTGFFFFSLVVSVKVIISSCRKITKWIWINWFCQFRLWYGSSRYSLYFPPSFSMYYNALISVVSVVFSLFLSCHPTHSPVFKLSSLVHSFIFFFLRLLALWQ